MRNWKNLSSSLLLVGALAASAAAQTPAADQAQPSASAPSSGPVTTVNEEVDRVIAREHDEVATVRHYSPIIETYIQDMKPDKDMGAIPVKDHYFLGQANLATGVVDNSLRGDKKSLGKL